MLHQKCSDSTRRKPKACFVQHLPSKIEKILQNGNYVPMYLQIALCWEGWRWTEKQIILRTAASAMWLDEWELEIADLADLADLLNDFYDV